MDGEDLDDFVEDFGELVNVPSRGISHMALINHLPGDTLNGLSRGNGVQLLGRADLFGVLAAGDVVTVSAGPAAGDYNPVGEPAKRSDGAFVLIDLNPVST